MHYGRRGKGYGNNYEGNKSLPQDSGTDITGIGFLEFVTFCLGLHRID